MTGHGGGPDHDGQDGGPYCLGNLANTPVEFIEAENPLSVEAYGFLPDTGGAGKYRGALGIVRQYRLLADEAMMNLRSDRHLHPCWGLFGGKGGAVARSCKISADGEQEMPSKFVLTFKKNDVLRAEMAGSGGYGDPLDRDPAAVGEDVRQEKVSIGHALAEYRGRRRCQDRGRSTGRQPRASAAAVAQPVPTAGNKTVALDPFKRELIHKGLVTIADNMILTVVRTSRSTVVKNNLDFSASICDGEGQLVAQGLALPVHIGATMPALQGCLDYFGDDVHPGDILANNDP